MRHSKRQFLDALVMIKSESGNGLRDCKLILLPAQWDVQSNFLKIREKIQLVAWNLYLDNLFEYVHGWKAQFSDG
jgi:hypothetical protein